ncbi:MAG: serine/threonine-protein kinase [Acidobacteriota bacterium]
MTLSSIVESPDPRSTPRRSDAVGFEEETRSFLQGRLRMLTGALAIFTAVLLAMFAVINVSNAEGNYLGVLYHVVIELPNSMVTVLLLVAAGLHRLLERKRLSAPALVTLDALFVQTLVLPVLVLYAALHTFSFSGFPVVVPFLCFVIMTRGVLVPSTAARTVLISAPASLGVLAIQLWYGASYAYPDQPYPAAHFTDMLMQNQMLLVGSIAVAAVASRVNLGLRRRSYQAAQLGQYEIHGSIGAGAMGEVFLARHAMLKRPTAVKLLRPDITGGGVLKRFEQEVQQTSRLTHPNTVEIFDYGHTAEGVFYYAMEYLDGADLRDIVELDGPMPPGRAIHVLSAACGALAEAHSKGIVHRDIKPANIMLCEQGGEFDVVKILDFGLVKNIGALAAGDRGQGGGDEEKRVVGTPETMAPEAVRESGVSRLSDVYSLAVVGYFLLTGKPIFDVESVSDFIRAHQVAQPIPLSHRNDAVPRDLEKVILKCLAKDPGQRPTSALVLRKALLECRDAGYWDQEAAAAWWKSWFQRYPRSELQEMAVEFRSGSFTSGDRPVRSSGERSGARSFGSLERASATAFVTIDGRKLQEVHASRAGDGDGEEVSQTRWETQL